MKKLISCIGLLFCCGMTAFGGSLNVSATETPNSGLYNYSYTFGISGTGSGFDNIYLGSDDLSPFNVQLLLNGTPTSDWTYLSNDTPQNYLQFYSQAGTPLGVGSSLGVSFTSSFGPANSHFVVGLNSGTNVESNEVTGVLAPTAVPEPAAAVELALAAGIALLCLGVKRLAQ